MIRAILAILVMILSVTYFVHYNSSAATPDNYKAAIAASAAYASLDETPVDEEIKKVPRSECTHCNGTGKIRSGDGIKVLDCPYCYPDEEQKKVAEVSKCGPECKCGDNCQCETPGQCLKVAQTKLPEVQEIEDLLSKAKEALDDERYPDVRKYGNEVQDKLLEYGDESLGGKFLRFRQQCDEIGVPFKFGGAWQEKYIVLNKAEYEDYIDKMKDVWNQLQATKVRMVPNVYSSSCGGGSCSSCRVW